MRRARTAGRVIAMTTHMQLPSTPPAGSAALAADLRRAVRGAVHVPGDPGYPAAASPWNVAVRQDPAAVVVAADAADVQAVVRVAVATGMRVAPQGPGHSAAALGGLEDAILLRTTALGD